MSYKDIIELAKKRKEAQVFVAQTQQASESSLFKDVPILNCKSSDFADVVRPTELFIPMYLPLPCGGNALKGDEYERGQRYFLLHLLF